MVKFWGGRRESNPQRPEPQSGALPVELLPPRVAIITRGEENWVASSAGPRSCRALLGLDGPWAAVPSVVLVAAYADVFESHGAEADGVEQVFGVHDEWAAEGLLDAGEIEAAKFRPGGAHD